MGPMATDIPTTSATAATADASTRVEPSSDVMTSSSSCCIDDSTSTIGALCRESFVNERKSNCLKIGNDDVDDDTQRLSRQAQHQQDEEEEAEEEEREYYYAEVYKKKNYSHRRRSSSSSSSWNMTNNIDAKKESENKKYSPCLEIFLLTLVFLVLLGLLADLFFSLLTDEMNTLNCTDDVGGIIASNSAGDVGTAVNNVDASQNFQLNLNDIPIIE